MKVYLVLTTEEKPIEITFKKDEYDMETLNNIYLEFYKEQFIGIYTNYTQALFIKKIDNEIFCTPDGDRFSDDFETINFLEKCLALNLDTNI